MPEARPPAAHIAQSRQAVSCTSPPVLAVCDFAVFDLGVVCCLAAGHHASRRPVHSGDHSHAHAGGRSGAGGEAKTGPLPVGGSGLSACVPASVQLKRCIRSSFSAGGAFRSLGTLPIAVAASWNHAAHQCPHLSWAHGPAGIRCCCTPSGLPAASSCMCNALSLVAEAGWASLS